ncbi:YobI family P-loop NTPase [Photobacterium alginatilyticum]|uniref:YobI-like P-loop NTPase domain-containing protein n=1 Tax=Photobacterium alginatilyticum TaxID=1775171 RepID=A0ABW9YL26_9GAMM|nr:hypothetical protein [Photobacterium alginatilyticum]NBI54562.1 hypothetical protein [Photobacterium alginatilyticum]
MELATFQTTVINKLIYGLRSLIHFLDRLITPVEEYDDERLCLTPTIKDKPEEYQHYFEQFDFFLDNCASKVRELALTGPYGSGKSTLLHSYFRERPHLNTVLVSLGTYLPSDNATTENLEHAIAKQVLYQRSDLEHRGSRFSFPIFKHFQGISAYFQSFVVVAWICVAVLAIIVGKSAMLQWLISVFSASSLLNIDVLLTVFMAAVPVCVGADVCRYLLRHRITRINPKDGDIDLQPMSECATSFSLYLEELLRFFVATKCDVLVIEDLDRFDCPGVFESLKELNGLINRCDQIHHPVRFVYAIRDDVFKGSDRTKFFDAIVPLVPVMSPFNAYERFRTLFTDPILQTSLAPLLKKVAITVPDMRVLRNIVNEFHFYRHVLATDPKTLQRLLAFIIYKNFYSDDFAKLYTNQVSAIDKAIAEKERIRTERVTELEASYRTLMARDKASNEELLLDEEEYAWVLRGALIRALISRRNLNNVNLIQNESIALYSIDMLVGLQNQRGNILIHALNNDKNSYATRLQASEFAISELDPKVVELRRQAIEDRHRKQAHDRSAKLANLRTAISEAKSVTWPLHEAMDSAPDANWVPDTMPVLEMFLRDGLIDEHYGLYLNHVLEGKLTQRDYAFIQALRERRPFDVTFVATDYAEIVSYLSDNDANSPAALNYGLLAYLLESAYSGQLLAQIIRRQLQEHEQCGERLYLMKSVLPQWRELLWTSVITDVANRPGELTKLELLELYCELLNVRELESKSTTDNATLLQAFDLEPMVIEAVSQFSDPSPVLNSLYKVGIQLSSLEDIPSLRSLLLLAVEHEIVSLNVKTLPVVCAAVMDRAVTLPISYEHLPDTPLFNKFFHNDLAAKITLYLSQDIKLIPDSECVELLNANISEETKVELISSLDFNVVSLELVPKDVWLQVITSSRVVINWHNIHTLIVDSMLSEGQMVSEQWLSDYLVSATVRETLEKSVPCPVEFQDNVFDFINTTLIDLGAYIHYVTMLEVSYTDEEFLSLSEAKMEMLIQAKRIAPSVHLFNQLQEHDHLNISYQFIKYNSAYFLSKPSACDDLSLDKQDVAFLLPMLELPYQLVVATNYQECINEDIDSKYWLPAYRVTINQVTPLDGLIRKNDITLHHLQDIGLEATTLIHENKLQEMLAMKSLSHGDKLNLVISQISHHQEKILTWADSSLGDDWPLKSTTIQFSEVNYALMIACVHRELISSVRITGSEIRLNHFKSQIL